MVTRLTLTMLKFIKGSVEQELDTMEDARKFARRIGSRLSEPDRTFLNAALRSRAQLRKCCAARRKRNP
jgi:hypothetical protein